MCIKSNSMSDSFLIKSFFRPLGRRCLVLFACLLPIVGMRTRPLNLRLTTQSTPLGFLQDVYRNTSNLASFSPYWEAYTSRSRFARCAKESSLSRRVTYSDSGSHIRLEAVRVLLSFLDNLGSFQRLDCHYLIINTLCATLALLY